MNRKIYVGLNGSKNRGPAEPDGGFFVIALSASLVAFFLGIAFALLYPSDAYSQAASGTREPDPSDRQAIHLRREFIYLGSRLIAIDESGISDLPILAEPVIWSPRTGLWRRFGESGLLPTAIGSIRVIRNAVGRIVGILDVTTGETTFFLRDVTGNLTAEMTDRPVGGPGSGILYAITAYDGSLRATLRRDGGLGRIGHASNTSVCLEVLPGCESSSAWINTSDFLTISDDHTIDWVTARFTTPRIDPSVHPSVSILPRNLYQKEINAQRWILDGVIDRGKSALDYFFLHPRRYNETESSDIRNDKSESRK